MQAPRSITRANSSNRRAGTAVDDPHTADDPGLRVALGTTGSLLATVRELKILSDFDGVWTDQAEEAASVRTFAIAALAQVRGIEIARAEAEFMAFVATVGAAPAAHGWAPDGRISAYVDEDPLCECSAVCRYIELCDDPLAIAYREAIVAAGFADLGAFGEHCFHAGSLQFRADHPPCMVLEARAMLTALLDAGAEVVVVSNSSTDKLVSFFAAAGIDAGEQPGHEVRVRGSAGKWFLGDSDEQVHVGGRSIYVDRPRYFEVIASEAPDLIIGDVFSLDLALPGLMRRRGDPRAPSRLALRRHGHTPGWVLDTRGDGAIDWVVDQVGDLARLLPQLASSPGV